MNATAVQKFLPFMRPSRSGSSLRRLVAITLCLSCAAHAGDILRGGAPAGSAGQRAESANLSTAAAAQAARTNARDTLARTARAVQDARKLQESARAAARVSSSNSLGMNPNNPSTRLPDVVNGLGAGGLEVDPGVSGGSVVWSGANLPVETRNGSISNVRIKQTAQTALLNWRTFHVGRKTDVYFDQKNGGADSKKWIAFNKVNDPTGVPSQILGSIRADGQVYLINRNGVIFGPNSQVTMPTFVASSLPINDNLISRGLLNNPDAQFLFSGLAIPANLRGGGTPAFNPEGPLVSTGKYGEITVQRGAVISSPTDAANSGGRVVLVGPNVTNSGTIRTPDGQTILAAGMQVGFDGHAASDASLRGLDVFVGSIAPTTGATYAGGVYQRGLVEALRGNVTLAGSHLHQNGVLDSSTSVSYNGRIDIQASYGAIPNTAYVPTNSASGRPFLFLESGSVTFGPGSVTRVIPETESSDTVIGTRLALDSQINANGKTIHMETNSVLQAKGGDIVLRAGRYNYIGGSAPVSPFVRSGGQIFLDSNTLIDAAGSVAAEVSIARQLLELELRGAEFARSPLQREGGLRGVPITLDIRRHGVYNGFAWTGTPLGDVTGYAALLQRDVAELTAQGGSVSLIAGSSVVMQPNSRVDVSGGLVSYDGARVQTTRLRYGGQLFDISDATPDRVYDGIYDGFIQTTSAKWGVTRKFAQPLAPTGVRWEPDYNEGAAGGSVAINGASLALDGEIVGRTVQGERQLDEAPDLSSLSLSFLNDDTSFATLPQISPTPPKVTFGEISLPGVGAFRTDASGNPLSLSSTRQGNVVLSPLLLDPEEGGFGSLTVKNPDGTIIVPKGVRLETAPGGAISLEGSNVVINGTIVSPGGSLSFQANNIPLSAINTAELTTRTRPVPVVGRGRFTLGTEASLSVGGLLVDRLQNSVKLLPSVTDGGSISIHGYEVNLGRGASVDASGGAKIDQKGKVTYGQGGAIAVTAGVDPQVDSVIGGRLTLGASLLGYSGGTGASLHLSAPGFQIGGTSNHGSVINLNPAFFNDGGFSSFHLTATGIAPAVAGQVDGNGLEAFTPGIVIAANTRIRPVAVGLLARPNRVGNSSTFVLEQYDRPEGLRSPVSLTFEAPGATDSFNQGFLLSRGDVIMGRNSSIVTDLYGEVSFSGNTVSLLGDVTAPGGRITIQGDESFPFANLISLVALPTVYLGPEVNLSTAGKAVTRIGERGARVGSIAAGGTVSLSGNIVAERGSVFDVSGSRGVLDLVSSFTGLNKLPTGGFSGRKVEPVQFETDAGEISLEGSEMLYADSTLLAKAGGTSANGGYLSISSSRYIPINTAHTTADINLDVKQVGYTLGGSASSRGIGRPLTGQGGQALPGLGTFSVDRLRNSGIESLTLGGNVRFSGDVSLTVPGRLTVASGGVMQTASNTLLRAGYVKLGQAFPAPLLPNDPVLPFLQTDLAEVESQLLLTPTYGAGKLVVQANLIDVGNLVFQQIGSATLSARAGDIRGAGNLLMAGDLVLEAGQIHPTTASKFNIFAYDYTDGGGLQSGSVTIRGGVARPLPLSAGGTLSVQASTIRQEGTLRAPIGTIRLGWDGTGTAPVNPVSLGAIATPVTKQLTLGSRSVTSVSAVDPATGRGILIPYGISFDGQAWVDPAGNDITVSGAPSKSIQLSGQSVTTVAGSVVDLRGGGDIFAYRWVEGNGGPEDILGSETSFAVIPGYDFNYAPVAPFNTRSTATNLRGATGYVNSTLQPGDQVTLGSSKGFREGTYTLLPARYALLPGAYLVTPLSGDPSGAQDLAEGSVLANGYRANNMNPGRRGVTSMERFELASGSVVSGRAEYQLLSGNSFLKEAAVSRDLAPPRLPVDSGMITFSSSGTLAINGTLLGQSGSGGRGSMVNISSPLDILINEDGSGGGASVLALSSSLLSRIQAQSILIGGTRTTGTAPTTVTTTAGSITVDNAGSPLTGSDIILVAKEGITLEPGAQLSGTGSGEVEDLVIGSASVAGSGDGSLVRVSGRAAGEVTRFGVSNSTVPFLNVGASVAISGGSVVLDSTYGTSLSTTASLAGRSTSLSSGQISIQLDPLATVAATDGLVLSGQALRSLEDAAQSIVLRSYSSIDVYGAGAFGTSSLDVLSLQANAIRGSQTGAGTATFTASQILLGNAADRTTPALAAPLNGQLTFEADQITTGANDLRIEGFANTNLIARSRILASDRGTMLMSGNATIVTPLLTGAGGAVTSIGATGTLTAQRGGFTQAGPIGGLGASVSLSGSSVTVDTNISLSSGSLALHALSGDVRIGSNSATDLDLSGASIAFLDVTRYTNGGSVRMTSDTGSVLIGALATVDVSATGLGNAGSLAIKASGGEFSSSGTILGSAESESRTGSFSLDAARVAGDDLAATDAILNAGSFNESRDYRIRTGDLAISGAATARSYLVALDAGNLTVSGSIDASGRTGGVIDLAANGDLTLVAGAQLDASGDNFDSAGKGGSVSLAAGTSRNGVVPVGTVLDLQAGTIDLSVASSASPGQFSGTLHLRAPQNATYTDVGINQIGTAVTGASAIQVEAYRLYDRTGTGTLNNTLRDQIRTDAQSFFGVAGSDSATATAVMNKLDPSGALNLILTPGAEIINSSGGLTMGSTTFDSNEDWDLVGFRFGAKSAPGVLTMRATENLTFLNALSDGFDRGATPSSPTNPNNPNNTLWLAPLAARNPNLPANSQSWSYRLTAGADLTSANFRSVQPTEGSGALADSAGIIAIGRDNGGASISGGTSALTASRVPSFFQVIRTGSGSIDINAGRSVRLLNPWASIYTAGTQVADPTAVVASNDFVTPVQFSRAGQGNLGVIQQAYGAYYSMAGGNLTISAGENLERKTRNNTGLIDDSSRQLPNNWLYRRGYIGEDGTYGAISMGSGSLSVNDPAASTSWWVDFSNFFQTSGALGGGNVKLAAGGDIRNFDAVIPTNARAPRGQASPSSLQELGGGDLTVLAGRDIDGGIYYVERGAGRLEAGSEITTNSTRSPSLGVLQNLNDPSTATLPAATWLPTTLFVGKSSFDVFAAGDVLMGPVSNPFLLPQGQNNGFWYKTYFNTYSEDSAVRISSLGGDVTLRNAATLPDRSTPTDLLRLWLERQNVVTQSQSASVRQPWLRLVETSIQPFSTVVAVRPPTMEVTSIAGDVNVVGSMTLFPSRTGQLELIAGGGSVNGLQPTGISNVIVRNQSTTVWTASEINVADANPSAVSGPVSPFSYFTPGSSVNTNNTTRSSFLENIDSLFQDSGSTTGTFGVTQTKLALHAPGGLHLGDTDPLRVFAMDGNLSGLTLFSPKFSRIYASNDISDIALYLQNVSDQDTSFVTAGRDIIPYNSASSLRNASIATGNLMAANELPLAGDIHIGGPGALQILAGRDLDLGTGPTNDDGTGSGIVSLGNIRNLGLPFDGADIVAGAGLGPVVSLMESDLGVSDFIDQYIRSGDGAKYLTELGVSDFDLLDSEQQARVALEVFYLILRDTGRSFNQEGSPGFGNYSSGFAAIDTLFGGTSGQGDILAQTRNIRTRTGGDISLFAPNGGISLSDTLLADAAVPPGIVTEAGGRISVFSDDNVSIGVGRIFTLRGGDMVIWSSSGDIAAGAASKTVASAPPTRVIIDPQSAAVETDLAGLATGGGIGVLAAVAGVMPGDVDLIAPTGIIDAGDAGIRVTGNINLAATAVVNSSNISVGGSSSGAPSAPTVAAPNIGGLTSASNTAGASNATATTTADASRNTAAEATPKVEIPSIVTVEVLGYGGGGAPEEEEDEEARRRG